MRTLLLVSALVFALTSCSELPAEPDAVPPDAAALSGLPHGCSLAAPPVAIVSSPRETLAVELIAAPDREAWYRSHLLVGETGGACGQGVLEVAEGLDGAAAFVVRFRYTGATLSAEPGGSVRIAYQGTAEVCVQDGSPCRTMPLEGALSQASPGEDVSMTIEVRESAGAPPAGGCGCRVVPSQTKVLILSPDPSPPPEPTSL